METDLGVTAGSKRKSWEGLCPSCARGFRGFASGGPCLKEQSVGWGKAGKRKIRLTNVAKATNPKGTTGPEPRRPEFSKMMGARIQPKGT